MQKVKYILYIINIQYLIKSLRRAKVYSGGRLGTAFLHRNPIKSAKRTFFRIFSIFTFRCIVNGAEIAPAIAINLVVWFSPMYI